MSFRYPLLPRILVEAKAYALESAEHTADYDGWKDQHLKIERIARGKFAQLWLAEFCRGNNIRCKADRSSPLYSDTEDLMIFDFSVDCKDSYVESMWPQVSVNCDKNPVDLYVFFSTAKNMDFIKPIGMASKKTFFEKRVFVSKGELIPLTKQQQRFEAGSYFIDPADLTGFEDGLQMLASADAKKRGAKAA